MLLECKHPGYEVLEYEKMLLDFKKMMDAKFGTADYKMLSDFLLFMQSSIVSVDNAKKWLIDSYMQIYCLYFGLYANIVLF